MGTTPPKQNPTRKNGSTKTDQHRKEGVHHSGKGDAEKIRGKKLKSSAGSRQGNKAHQGGERGPGDGSPRRCSKARRQPAPLQQNDAESVQKGTAEAA